jgi:hypothetical protein
VRAASLLQGLQRARGHASRLPGAVTPMSSKDVLEIVVVPVALALIALAWPEIQSFWRRQRFRGLIVRELREIAPFPERARPGLHWWDHATKRFVHRTIFDAAAENRDFILSLPPDLVYDVSQLWAALEQRNMVQWLHFLRKLSAPSLDGTGEVVAALGKWTALIDEYAALAPEDATAGRSSRG